MLLVVQRVDFKLAAAAAEAKSALPDTLRCETRGRLLVTGAGAPFTVLFMPAPTGAPDTVECRLGPPTLLLMGELAEV